MVLNGLQTILKLAKMKPWVIRGNASEIMALAGAVGTTRGVDSTAESEEALVMGKQLALDLGTVVAISGRVDYVSLPCNLQGLLKHSIDPCTSLQHPMPQRWAACSGCDISPGLKLICTRSPASIEKSTAVLAAGLWQIRPGYTVS